ncbi:hypothetical protein GCM10011609_55230 [Lentzea pudingi]|uniref:Uncharacterized protein n=1 Tax=Lentzea pudingi TaxID=1789439 RepID=A0ABQ2IE86_9PSEU|nr:hypothetical protein GCM10011609_55230 [Lentzea pudingi]
MSQPSLSAAISKLVREPGRFRWEHTGMPSCRRRRGRSKSRFDQGRGHTRTAKTTELLASYEAKDELFTRSQPI